MNHFKHLFVIAVSVLVLQGSASAQGIIGEAPSHPPAASWQAYSDITLMNVIDLVPQLTQLETQLNKESADGDRDYHRYLQALNSFIAGLLNASIFSEKPKPELKEQAKKMCDYERTVIERIPNLTNRQAWNTLTDLAYRYDVLDDSATAEKLYERARPLKSAKESETWSGTDVGKPVKLDFFSANGKALLKLKPKTPDSKPTEQWTSLVDYLKESYIYYTAGYKHTRKYLVEKGLVE